MAAPNILTLAHFIEHKAEAKPDHVIVTFEGEGARDDEVRTYRDLFDNSHRIARGLIDRGLQRGERFALLLRNHPQFIESLVAASISGTVAVPIDPRTRGGKLAFTLINSEAKGVICGDYSLANVAQIRAQLPNLEWILVLESGEEDDVMDTSDVEIATSLDEVLLAPMLAVDVRLESPRDPLQIIYTSGTTGDPKGVVFPNVRFVGAMAGGRLLLGWNEDDRPYTGLSLSHGNAQLLTLAPALGMDLPVVFSRKFTKSRLWDICRAHGCTLFNLLGGMATAIYSEPERPDDADNPVRMVLSAGMPAAIWEAFERRFDLEILEMYGAIEGGMAIKPVGQGPIGSFGKPPGGNEMTIVDESGDEVPAGVVGELVSRPKEGPTPTVEYFHNPEASLRKTAGGWLHSGDMCHRDEKGWFFFDFRKGGGIRHNGDFVSPGFVEKVLAEHDAITDVFVYGVPARSGAPGESDVVAAVVPSEGRAFDQRAVDDIFAACRRGLEPNFVPAYLQVVAQIPKTASEKPQERFLLDDFAAQAGNVFVEK